MKKLWGIVVPALCASLAFAAPNAPKLTDEDAQSNQWAVPVEAVVSAPKSFHRANEDVNINVSFTNNGAQSILIPKFMLDPDEIDRSFIKVMRNGVSVAYTGPLVKRAAPKAEDMIEIAPGQTIDAQYEISSVFKLNEGGNYEVQFVNSSKHFVGGRPLATLSVGLDIEPSLRIENDVSHDDQKAGGDGGISYTGRCTTSEKSALVQALTAAGNYADAAASYFVNNSTATARYTTWFGTYSSANFATVGSHFSKIRDALNTKPIVLDCSCNKRGTFAFVYPNQPYKIYLCGAFWTAPLTGTDSKGGTIIHEMSHFTVNGGTNDYAYGQTAAKRLAISNPAQAIFNADSHEYFVENTPSQQ
jgi:peptidyl-Lys metalloendopeptidase